MIENAFINENKYDISFLLIAISFSTSFAFLFLEA